MSKDYYKTKESVEEYINLAKDVSGKKLIEKLGQFLPKHAYVLEIGSGPGTDWQILNETHHVVGSDNSQEFLNRLKAEHPNGEFIELDATSLKTERTFDGIYSNKVLHHLKDMELKDSVHRQYEILKPGGIICHSFWRGEGSEIFKGLFVNYHDKEDLMKCFKAYFHILLIEPYKEFEDEDSLLLIAERK